MKTLLVSLMFTVIFTQGFALGGHRGTFFKEVTDVSSKTTIVEYKVSRPISKPDTTSITLAGTCFVTFVLLGMARFAICGQPRRI